MSWFALDDGGHEQAVDEILKRRDVWGECYFESCELAIQFAIDEKFANLKNDPNVIGRYANESDESRMTIRMDSVKTITANKNANTFQMLRFWNGLYLWAKKKSTNWSENWNGSEIENDEFDRTKESDQTWKGCGEWREKSAVEAR